MERSEIEGFVLRDDGVLAETATGILRRGFAHGLPVRGILQQLHTGRGHAFDVTHRSR